MRKIPLELRFWKHVNKKGKCWLWTGGTNGRYGVVGRPDRRGVVGAHIASWFLSTGSWPSKDVLHKCDTPLCVRFSHLFQGTQKDNARDAKRKNRHMHGEMYGKAKLTDRKVKKILILLKKGEFQTTIAKKFGVSSTTIHNVQYGLKWSHVDRGDL